ncbi:MAG: sulfite exporter TauE/SafE family protein [Bacilli bacterium]
MMENLLITLIIIICSIIQGFCGFGFSLVLIPLLACFLPLHQIIYLNVIFSFLLNLSLFIKIRKYAKLRSLLPLISVAIIFTIVGAWFTGSVNEKYLKIVLGFILILSSLINLLHIEIKFHVYQRYYLLVGLVCGILNGISGVGGPPLILFFSNLKMDKLVYKATLNTIFLSLNVVALISYTSFDYLSLDIIKLGLIYGVVVIMGAYIGLWISNRVKEQQFKLFVTVAILLMGIFMIVGEL